MATWWEQAVTGLGNANAPFGFAPQGVAPSQEINPAYNSGMDMIGDIGFRMLANVKRNPLEAFGQSYIGAEEAARSKSKEAFAAQQMMMEADEKKKERARQQQEQEQRESFLSTLPPDVQMKARSVPGFLEDYVKATDPAFQKVGGNKVFGTVYFDDKGNPYVLDETGQMRPPGGISGDVRLMDPYDKAAAQSGGKLEGDAPRYVVKEYVEKIRPAMTATTEAMAAVSQAKQLLEKGIETGSNAEVAQALRGWGATIGLNVDESVLSNTQAYQNFIGNVVIPKMQQLGGNDSNEEMRKMYSLSGGDITQAAEALRLTVDYTEKLLQKRLADYQAYEKVALPYLGGLPSVPSTSGLGAAPSVGGDTDISNMSDEELEAIINGQ